MMRLRRRLLPLALLALVLVALPLSPVRAQIPMIANGVITATNASVNVANTTSEQLLFQYPIPAALMASWTTTNAAFASTPLHLVLNGTILSTGAGAGSFGINLGSSLATLSISNQGFFTPTTAGPLRVEVWAAPIATVTTQNCTDLRPCNVSVYLSAQVTSAFQTTTGLVASSTIINGVTLGTLGMNVPATLNVLYRWSAAASGNSLNIYNGTLLLGN